MLALHLIKLVRDSCVLFLLFCFVVFLGAAIEDGGELIRLYNIRGHYVPLEQSYLLAVLHGDYSSYNPTLQ